jgi:hypothetical protein
MFKLLLMVRINNGVGLCGIVNFRMLRGTILPQQLTGIPLMEGVSYPLQSKDETPPLHLCRTIIALQGSLNL